MIKKESILILCIIFFAQFVWAGQINSVSLENNQLKIYLTEKSEYRVVPQDDPFKFAIEVFNINPGILTKKMFFHEGILSEVSAKPSDKGSIIEILMAEPLKADIKTEGNVLLISFAEINKKTDLKPPKIIDISMEKTEQGYEISIIGDDVLPEPDIIKKEESIDVAFSGVTLDVEPSKNIPVLVKKQNDALIFSFLFGKDAETEVFHLGEEVILDVRKPTITKTTPKQEVKVAETAPPKEKTISIDLQDADIVGALRFLADVGGYNLVVHPRVGGKITFNLKNVSVSQAIDIICKNSNLVKVEEDNIIRILPIESYMIELVLQKKETRVYKLKYVKPSNLLQRTENLRTVLADSRIFQFFGVENIQIEKDPKTGAIEYRIPSIPEKRETERSITYQTVTETRQETTVKIIGIAIDELTGSLIINAPVSLHKEIEKVIAQLDIPQKQILLEARIIEISSSFSKSLGFEWGISWAPPGSRTTIVGSQSGTTPVPGGNTPIAVNLPASTGRVSQGTSAITIGYINASGTLALDLRISALQQTGKGKVISSPKIITLDNQKAVIIQGESIPYGEIVVTTGVPQISTKFKDVAVSLEVTPRVIDENTVNLYIYFNKEDLVEFINIGMGVVAPRTLKISGATDTVVRVGETVVLGGIYKKVERMSTSKVPGLGDIPLVGELFTSRGRDEDTYEVLVFITPRIINEGSSY